MGTTKKQKWKLPRFLHHLHSSPPPELLCPISATLMSDPVILPSGHTFDRASLLAAVDLRLLPASTPLVPNLALRSTIRSWAHSHHVPDPHPPDRVSLLRLARAFEFPDREESSKEFASASNTDLVKELESTSSVSPPSSSSSSFSAPRDFSGNSAPAGTRTPSFSPELESGENSPLHDGILLELKSSELSVRENALLRLRCETRDSESQRVSLCTRALLVALRPFLLSPQTGLQSNALASVVNLSLHPENKAHMVRSGVVPPVLFALRSQHSDSRSHAVAAIYSLSVEDVNKAAIGALGALSPLLGNLADCEEGEGTRRDAALALYHLSLNCSSNRTKLARTSTARVLLKVVLEGPPVVSGFTMMVVGNLAGCGEGRAALMDAGAVEAAVEMVRTLGGEEIVGDKMVNLTRDQCVWVLWALSKGSLRFKGLAKSAGAEDVFLSITMEDGGEENVKDMARRMLKVIRGEKYVCQLDVDGDDDDAKSIMSDPTMSLRRNSRTQSIPGVNSSEF